MQGLVKSISLRKAECKTTQCLHYKTVSMQLLLLPGYSEESLCQIYGDRWLLCNKVQQKTFIQAQI